MEEIKLNPQQLTALCMESEEIRNLMDLSKKSPLVGMPWNEKVYDYLFESGLSAREVNEIMCLGGYYVVGPDALDEEEV